MAIPLTMRPPVYYPGHPMISGGQVCSSFTFCQGWGLVISGCLGIVMTIVSRNFKLHGMKMLISAKDHLGQFGISMGDALAFVAGNIGQPQVIHQVF
ncbi:MAG: hypothetical protein LWW84_06280, partial [Azovibrio sp.]|nr:hypothetical protein [Azovibrio sp.]